jgi:hypothetical protein
VPLFCIEEFDNFPVQNNLKKEDACRHCRLVLLHIRSLANCTKSGATKFERDTCGSYQDGEAGRVCNTSYLDGEFGRVCNTSYQDGEFGRVCNTSYLDGVFGRICNTSYLDGEFGRVCNTSYQDGEFGRVCNTHIWEQNAHMILWYSLKNEIV